MTLITINPGETRQITYAASLAHTPPVQQYLVANLDLVQTIYIGPADAGRQVPDLSTDIARSQLVALQGIHVSARQDWYAYNPNTDTFVDIFGDSFQGGPVTIDVVPDSAYWAPSPAQSAAQISALGLMKDTTGQSINSNTLTVGANTGTTAAHTGTTATNTGSTATNTATALTSGIPPGVPNISSADVVRSGTSGSPHTLFTFGSAGRLWSASLSFAAATDTTYTPGNTQLYAELSAGALALEAVELAVSNTNQTVNDHGDVTLNGLSVAGGTMITLDVNNATAVSGVSLRASCTVLYSIP